VNQAHKVRVAAGAGLIATLLPAAVVAPAQAATAPGWRLVSARHIGAAADADSLLSVVATGRSSAWAFGGNLNQLAKGAPIAERWNGRSWHVAALPSGLAGAIFAASAPAANDVWAVGGNGYALHFNGSRWSVAKRFTAPGGLAPGALVPELSITAFSPTNVWVFGGPFLGTWHLHGTIWTRITGAGGSIHAASALSAGNIWGLAAGVVHFNGRTWRPVTNRALNAVAFTDILALSPRNVWALGFPAGGNLNAPVLLHLHGTTWTRIKVPLPVIAVRLAADGAGGVWMPVLGPRGTSALHLSSAGVFRRFTIPRAIFAFGLARIPGTASLWAAGLAGPTSPEASIWAFGPV
jgi:hypothetical protein